MTTAYVYSPFSSRATSLNCYCSRYYASGCSSCSGTSCKQGQNCATCVDPCICKSCCWHVITQSGFVKPIDISASVDRWINAYLSAAIASVRVKWSAKICNTETGDINQGTILELYAGLNATGTFIGRVLYGHVKNRQHSDGAVINKSGPLPWFVQIGQVPQPPPGSTCYQGSHVHMEAKSEVGTASRTPSQCDQSLTEASTVIYSWTY